MFIGGPGRQTRGSGAAPILHIGGSPAPIIWKNGELPEVHDGSKPAAAGQPCPQTRLDAPTRGCHIRTMSLIRTVCVYCGSSPGTSPAFVEAALQFGTILAQNKIGLVYGGGSQGLMGAIAKSVLERHGHVTAIIPEFLKARERLFSGAQEIIVTRDMHERKRAMFERADAFVALPGGIGTLEELVEQMTWAQLGRHRKPILMLNIEGFWDPLVELIDHMRNLGFIHSELLVDYQVARRVEDILPMLNAAIKKAPTPEEREGAPQIERM